MSEVCLVRDLTDVMGISCWTTYDVTDADTGISGAGYESLSGLYVADCTAMGDKLLELSYAELTALVDEIKVPVLDWLQIQRETGDKGTV